MEGILLVVDRLGRSIAELEQANGELVKKIKELEAAVNSADDK